MGKLTDVVKRWSLEDATLESPNLTVTSDGNRATLKWTRTSRYEGEYRAFYEITEEPAVVQFYLYAPNHVPEGRRLAVAETIVRAQNRIKSLGEIELDMGDGEIRFHGAIDTEGRRLTSKLLSKLFVGGCAVLDRYLPDIGDVVVGNASPAAAVAEANREAPTPFNAADAPAWDTLPGTDRVQAWSRELRSACNTVENAESAWELTGRAVVLVGEEMRTCRNAAWRAAVDADMQFVCIEDDDVMNMPSPAAFRRIAPVMVFLRPGKWMLESEDGDSAETTASMKAFQSRLARWIRKFDETQPVVYVTSAFKITNVDESLRCVELFDRFLNVPSPTMEAWGNAMIARIGRDNCAASMTQSPAKVGQLFRTEYIDDRRESLAFLRIQRLLATLGRPMEFLDLVNLETHGFVEEDAPVAEANDIRRQTAYHEAGHAAVAVIDSHGKNIPDYASIVPSAFFKGVVVDGYDYQSNQGDRLTYAAFRHKIRLLLAGRAAEELYLGPALVSNGSRGDLEKAACYASDGVGLLGFAPSMDQPGRSAGNLNVAVGKPSASHVAHVEELVRGFLATEYAAVMEILAAHRPFVDAIAERLLWDPILDQKTLAELAEEHVPGGVGALAAQHTR